MTEHDVQVALVVLLVVNSLVQGLVSFALWFVMNRQQGQTPFSIYLKRRELSLSAKSFALVGFHLLLITVLVTGDVWDSFIGRMLVYASVVVASAAAIVYSVLLGYRLVRPPRLRHSGIRTMNDYLPENMHNGTDSN